MIRTIAGTARISTKIIKDGSIAGRDAFCQKLENKFYNRIEQYKHSQFDYIGKNIKEILPTKLIQVEKMPDDLGMYNGAVILANEVEKTIPADVVGYIVALKQNFNKEHFGKVNIEVLMHEIHHLFNYFTHPKVPNRIYKISKLPQGNQNFEKFFVENFQSPMRPNKSKEATQKLLSDYNGHKIDILQYLRYKLTDEAGAYNTGEKYLDLYRSKRGTMPPEFGKNMIQTLFLREKLDFITDMLKKTLKIERENFRKSLNLNN